jgi:hypothetical protein
MRYIGIIILLVLCLTLLLLTGCIVNTVIPETTSGNLEYQGDTSDTGTVDTGGTVAMEGTGTVKVDTTKPVITGSRAPLPNSFGWNNTDVKVSFSCADTGAVQSGIAINTVAGKTLTTEGKDQSVTNTGVCTDAAGNTAAPVTVSNINIDKTPPVVTLTLLGKGEYALNESITATWSATDDLSGVEVSKAKKTISIDTKSVGKKKITLPAGIVKDKAGNSSQEVTTSYVVLEVDTTKPVITGSRAPLPNSFGWNNTDVTVSFSCADTGAVQSGIAINTVAGKTLTKEGKDQSVTNTGVCIDAAGNTAAPVTVSNINIDKTPPVVTFTPGIGEYVLNQSITASWTKTFTLPAGTAKDKAGNSSLEVTISYSVIANVEEPETENSQKWSGLGMGSYWDYVDEYLATWIANGFIDIRLDIPGYLSTNWLSYSKAKVITAVAAGARVLWGVSSNPSTITAANWPTFRQAILDAATWAQANGVSVFQLGNEEEARVDGTTITATTIRANLRSVATDVQAIFTGNIIYSYACGNTDAWIAEGKGDIDLIGINTCIGGEGSYPTDYWKTYITDMIDAFGADDIYITEFSPSWSSIDDYSTDEAVQAAAVAEMLDWIKASGISRAYFYTFYGDTYGVVKNDGIYRLLWNQALLNTGPAKFATVPTKTTTASLPDTIALIPK